MNPFAVDKDNNPIVSLMSPSEYLNYYRGTDISNNVDDNGNNFLRGGPAPQQYQMSSNQQHHLYYSPSSHMSSSPPLTDSSPSNSLMVSTTNNDDIPSAQIFADGDGTQQVYQRRDGESSDAFLSRNYENSKISVTTAEELDHLLIPIREREAQLQQQRLEEKNRFSHDKENPDTLVLLDLVQQQQPFIIPQQPSSSATAENSLENLNIATSTLSETAILCQKQKTSPLLTAASELSEIEEEQIRAVVKSLEAQLQIKELQRKEMELMRLTGAEMEDMVENEETYRYSEYVKNIVSSGSAGENVNLTLTTKNSSLLRRAEAREIPRLFQIVAAKPPPLKDIPGIRDHLIVDELPPDPELLPIRDTGRAVERDVTQTGQVVGGSEMAISRNSPVKVFVERTSKTKSLQEQHDEEMMGLVAAGKEKNALNVSHNNNNNRKDFPSLISSNEMVAQRASQQLKPVEGVISTYHAASPHLFDATRHARHRQVFATAMKHFKERQAEEEHQNQLSNANYHYRHHQPRHTTILATSANNNNPTHATSSSSSSPSVYLSKYSPLRILNRKQQQLFTNRGIPSSYYSSMAEEDREPNLIEQQEELLAQKNAMMMTAAVEQQGQGQGDEYDGGDDDEQLLPPGHHQQQLSNMFLSPPSYSTGERTATGDYSQNVHPAVMVSTTTNPFLGSQTSISMNVLGGAADGGRTHSSQVLSTQQENANVSQQGNTSLLRDETHNNNSSSRASIVSSSSNSALPPVYQQQQQQKLVSRSKSSISNFSAKNEEQQQQHVFSPGKKKDLRQLLAEQQQLIRKAEKDDAEKYRPMVQNFIEYNEMMAEKMWSQLGGK